MTIQYSTSPIATDAFSRGMLEAYAEKPLFAAGFMTLFKNRRFFTENDTTDIQIRRTGQTMAPMVVRGVSQPLGSNRHPVADKGWTEISRVFPLVERTGTLTSDQLTKRVFGEAVYSRLTKKQRAIVLAAQKFSDVEDSVRQTCEYLAAQSIMEGKQVALLEQTGDEIEFDFRRNPDNQKSFLADWATPATVASNDIDAACDVVEVNGKAKANLMICGETKFKEWQATTEFKTMINDRHKVNVLADFNQPVPPEIAPLLSAGFNYQFTYKTPKGRKLHVLTYDHTYTPQNGGTPVRFMDTNKVVVLSTDARFDACFGPADYIEMDSAKISLYMDVFGIDVEGMSGTGYANLPSGFQLPGLYYDAYLPDGRKKGLELRIQTAPIFATVQTDAICTLSEPA